MIDLLRVVCLSGFAGFAVFATVWYLWGFILDRLEGPGNRVD